MYFGSDKYFDESKKEKQRIFDEELQWDLVRNKSQLDTGKL